MGLETYRKEQNRLEKEQARKDGTEEAPEPTVKEILADPEQNRLFGKMLEADDATGNAELVTRLHDGSFDFADIAALDAQKVKYLEKIKTIEEFEETLTPESLAELARLNPQFAKVISSATPENVSDMLKKELKEVALTNPAGFDQMKKDFDAVQDFKDGKFADLNKSIQDFCEEKGVKDPDKYLKILAITDFDTKKKAIEDMIKEDYGGGWGGSVKHFFDGQKTWELLSKTHEIDAVYAELDKYKEKAAGALALTIFADDTLKKALAGEILGQKNKPEATLGMADGAKRMPNTEATNKVWVKFKDNMWPQADWDGMDELTREYHKREFLSDCAKKTKAEMSSRGGGFWATIFLSLIDSAFTSFDVKKLA